MKTEILKIKGDWQEVVNDCRSTVGKSELNREPSSLFKRKILMAEHSPIRDIIIKWRWADIKSWITVHWVRHKWECFVRSQRSDRTGIPRDKLPQDAPVVFVGEANAQHLIDTQRKRLCFMADPETREYAYDLKLSVHEVEPEIADVMVPNCVYRGFCPEMTPCGFWAKFSEELTKEELIDGQKRYDAYNKWFASWKEV